MFLLSIPLGSTAYAAVPPQEDEAKKQIDDTISKIISELDLSSLQKQLDGLTDKPQGYSSAKGLVEKLTAGGYSYIGADLLDLLLSSINEPIQKGIVLFLELLLLLAISGVLSQLMKSFSTESAAKIANLVVYSAAALLIISTLRSIISMAGDAITSLLNVSQSVFPILTMLLAATGGLASTAVIQPAFSMVVETTAWLTRELLIPAALFGGVLAIAGNLTEKNLLSEFGSLLRNGSVWIAGAIMTVFVAITAIQGPAAASYDGISFRAAKYAVNSMIPYVGGMFSDMADTLVGCSLLVRNAIGALGLIALVFTVLQPVITILVTYLAFKLAASLAGAFESKQLANVLSESSKVMILMVVILLMAFVMLFIMLTIAINAGNSILAMR